MARFGAVFKICSRQFLCPSTYIVSSKLSMECRSDFHYSSFSNKCQNEEEELQQNDQIIHQKLTESRPSVVELHTVIEEMLNSGKMPDDATLFALADSKEGNEVGDALNLPIPDFENDFFSNMKSTVILVENLIKFNKLIAAYSLFRALRNRGIVPDLEVYNSLLTAASEASEFKLACHIFKDLLGNRFPDSTSYFALSKASAKTGNAEVAYNFCMELAEDSFLCNATVLNRFIYAFAGTGQMKIALGIFEYMKHHKYKSDLVTYNTIIDFLGKSGQVDATFHEFLAMKDSGHDPDLITYHTLINNFSRLGRLDLCSMVLREMTERGFEPDLRTYTAIIDSFGRIGQVDKALMLFNQMKKRGCKTSIYVYRSLTSNLRKAGNAELAKQLSEEMNACSSNLIGPKDFKKKQR